MLVKALEWSGLPLAARLAATVFLTAGLTTLVWALAPWRQIDLGLFLGYLVVSTAAAALRIKLPGVAGTLSLHFFFVLICIPQLGLAQTMLVACAGTLLQCVLFLKPFKPFATAFEVSTAILATASASGAYHAMSLQDGASGRSPLLMVVTASVLFLVSTIPPAIVLALTESRSLLPLWRDSFFWTFPHYIAGGGAAGLLSLLGYRTGWETTLLIVPVVYWMYHSYQHYSDQLLEERRQVRDLGALHFRTIEALALAIEGHDPSKHGHLRRVSIYVTEIGRQMGLAEIELQALHAASMLHDIGKLAVPEHIVTKPGKLTDAEFERMKVHPLAGAEILEQVQFPYPVAPIVRAHHEKWDGSGYPSGLKGNAIPLGARILAAVDCLDALISDRYHRRAMTIDQAMEYLHSESGKSFDPAVVAILSARYRELEERVRAAQQDDLRLGGLLPATRIAAARQEEQQFFQLARDLGNSLSLDKTLAAVADRLRSMCPHDSLVIFLRRERVLIPEYAVGLYHERLAALSVGFGKAVSGWVAEHRAAARNADPSTEVPGTELQSALAVPLEGVSGLIGVITLYARGKDAFTADDLRVLTGVASRASAAIENSIKYSQAEQSATTDVLTGLANARSLFLHLDGELARAKRHQDNVTVLVCDLDRFKQLNDLHGHMEGNRALKSVAQALKKQCREYDFVARMGGDEFVIVLPSHKLGSSVETKIEQLRQAAEEAVAEIGGAIGVGMSIGHASFPDDGDDAEALLAAADRRMYRMKQQSAIRAAESTTQELRRLSENLGTRETIH